jgi:uncharacterized protein YdaU (DUF1376 family)
MSKIRNKNWIVLGVLFVFVIMPVVSAQETYIESIRKLNDKIDQSEKDVRGDISSFNEAFKDAFKLIDDEISRLLYGNAAMVGIVFAIMFLVYAKTTTKTKRDMQVLLAAHSKHVDNIVSARLDEFMSRFETNVDEKKGLTRLNDDIGSLIEQELKEVEQQTGVVQAPKRRSIQRLEESVGKMTHVEEAKVAKDGLVHVPRRQTTPLNRIKKRLRTGLFRLLGKKEVPKVKIQEFRMAK